MGWRRLGTDKKDSKGMEERDGSESGYGDRKGERDKLGWEG